MSICTCWVDAGSRGRQAERIDDAAAVPGGTSSTRYPELCTTAYPVQCGLGCRRSHVYPDTSYRVPSTEYWSSLLIFHKLAFGLSSPISMSLFDRLQADLNAARKAQDKARVLVLGTIFSDAKNKKMELRRDLTDDEVVDLPRKGIKRRREFIEMYTGKRDDLAAKEREEVVVLEAYLPAAVSDDEIRVAVRAVIAGGATQIGAVMGKVLPQFKGRAEGSTVNAIAREALSRQR